MKKSLLVFLVLTAMCLTIGCNKKTTGLQWSKIVPNVLNQKDAVKYCKNLNEDSHNDWRLPNIDELRTLIKNCPGSQTGGACAISDPDHLADSDYLSDNCHCEYRENYDGYYSKLGDNVLLWSSSVPSGSSDSAWCVDFNSGHVVIYAMDYTLFVRCVRNAK